MLYNAFIISKQASWSIWDQNPTKETGDLNYISLYIQHI